MMHDTSVVRAPAVAGTFYPRSAAVLGSDVDRLLAEAPEYQGPAPRALVVPHAGYVYSGPVAASAYAALRASAAPVRRVVLLGPSHRVFLDGVAAPGPNSLRWLRTPLGDVEIDGAALDRAGVARNASAHAREHSLEVQLPFLQRVVPAAKVCPIVCGRATPEEVGAVIESLFGDDTVVVVSSDLSHYLPYAEGRALDEQTAARIVALDDALDGDRACGFVGVRGLLWFARRRGLVGKLLDLRSSGDTAGPRDEVVGYGAFAFSDRLSAVPS